ncbi:uncharacterized protein SPSK_08645 [Sporothrix schenckii 1099-18]|uniref:Uncharacterized protein n=1 Tax=Sporothrix schenckii 1099-18 TaxID=1397361 RepID=A0A0F2M6C6_SPOSC|nr:uncharacterized protein SPSK_08645 [Sporothrix schenckii 1099-18]KJR85187.1 hypothetical protein SPSK_08645 [Sporothrix schenckii 1099-18]
MSVQLVTVPNVLNLPWALQRVLASEVPLCPITARAGVGLCASGSGKGGPGPEPKPQPERNLSVFPRLLHSHRFFTFKPSHISPAQLCSILSNAAGSALLPRCSQPLLLYRRICLQPPLPPSSPDDRLNRFFDPPPRLPLAGPVQLYQLVNLAFRTAKTIYSTCNLRHCIIESTSQQAIYPRVRTAGHCLSQSITVSDSQKPPTATTGPSPSSAVNVSRRAPSTTATGEPATDRAATATTTDARVEPEELVDVDADIAATATLPLPLLPPRYPSPPVGHLGAAPSSSSSSTQPPSFSSLYPPPPPGLAFQEETKRVLPSDPKREGESSRGTSSNSSSNNKSADSEPPPAYSEEPIPLPYFTYLMAAAGGASSIITQVQQGGPPINNLSTREIVQTTNLISGDVGLDETIAMDLRGTRFVLSRDELLTLPEFVLLSLFPNGLFPEGHMGGFNENDAIQVDYDPASLQYMLDFFRGVAQSIPSDASPSPEGDVGGIDPMGNSKDDASKRAGIIVLREDLDFYAIPPRSGLQQAEMMDVKRAAARALLAQNGIFSGLKRSDEPGTTEAHLIEMLTAGGFDHDDAWGHRAGEPNKAVICSLALARLRSDIRGNEMSSNAVGMAQKLLLFWRKPARRCWWEGVQLDNVEGVEGPLKVWIRRVWTLEMSVIGLR